MSYQVTYPGDAEVDLRVVFRAIRRRLPLLVVIAAAVGAAVYFLLSSMDATYQAETTVLIESGESSLTRTTTDANDSATLLDQQGIASQVQLIRSRDLARAVIAELGLASHPEFDPAQQQPSLVDRALGTIGLGDDGPQPPAEELVLNTFLDHLTVNSIEQTRVIAISFTSTDPQLAADVANAVARQYIAMQQSVRQDTTADATQWLQDEIDDLSNRVQSAEADVASYRSSENLFALGDNGLTLAEQQMADISASLSAQRAARVDAEARAAQMRADLESGASLNAPEVLDSPLIQSLRSQQATLRSEIAEASATMLPGHPRIQELNAQLVDLDEDIRAEAGRILIAIENEAELARSREADLSVELDQLRAEVARTNAAQVELNALQRVADADSQFLELYLSRYREAATRLDTTYQPVNARVISTATAPIDPVYPQITLMTIGSALVALILGVSFTVVGELASGRATRPVLLPAPVPAIAGAVPAGGRVRWSDGGDVRRMMPYDPGVEPALAEQADRALGAIAAKIRTNEARRIIITMADGISGGRPLAAVALARKLARSGARVLLVDLHQDDADRIAMGSTAKLPGFAELMAGEVSFSQVIFRDRASPAHFIPAGRHPSGRVLEGERFSTLFAALDHTYDHVVYDIDRDLVAVLGPTAGIAIVVTEAGPSDPRAAAAYDAVTGATAGEVMLLVTDPVPGKAETGAAA